MRLFSQSVLCATLVALCTFAYASAPAKADVQTIRSADSAVWGAVGTDFLNYKEALTPITDSERGSLPSLAGGVSYMGNSNIYLAFEGNVAFGDEDYNGALQNRYTGATTPYKSTTNSTITNLDGKLGKGFALGRSMMLTPYGEVGFRYWTRDLGQYGTEDYDNFNALAGLMFQLSPIDRLILTAYGSAGMAFGGEMKTSGDTYDLGSSGMYKLGGKVGFDVTRKVELFTSLDFSHFRYVNSSWVDNAMEPSSFTNDTAIRVGLAYHYR